MIIRKLWVYYSVEKNCFHLYNINEQVLPLIRNQNVSFTSRSSNIQIGDYIVFQRKGSEKGENGHDINSIEHGANHIQIKMKVKNFFNSVKPVSSYSL